MNYQYHIDNDLPTKALKAQVKDIYNKVYQTGLYDPTNSVWCWNIVRTLFKGFKKALDVGCGKAYGIASARSKGYNIYGCDIANLTEHWAELGIREYCRVAPAHALPYKNKEFDLVVCSDVLEHIPEKLMDETLQEIRRVGNFKYWFHVDTDEERCSKIKDDHIAELHITRYPKGWWLQKFKDNGFKVGGEINWDQKYNMWAFICEREEA